MAENDGKKTQSNSWRGKLWQKPGKWFYFGLPIGGYALFAIGIVFWTGFNLVLDASNSEAFCISCHEMKDNVYEEYRQTVHYSNRTGVRAICSDCHVPKEWFAKMRRKMRASIHELPHWAMGTIDTPEKFDERRLHLAKRVWNDMQGSDSRECRNCHELEHMDLEIQPRSASTKHTLKRQTERGETCIDCHQGVAHTLPEGWEDEF
jgi:nitrate/TMAO reductase-like tetraheme cytochrome c subunit